MLQKVAEGKLLPDEVKQLFTTGKDLDGKKVDWNLETWYKEKHKFMEAEKEYLEQMAKWYTRNPRCLTSIYVHGMGGQHKDTLIDTFAERVADNRGIYDIPAPGLKTTPDFAGKYRVLSGILCSIEMMQPLQNKVFMCLCIPMRVCIRKRHTFFYAL